MKALSVGVSIVLYNTRVQQIERLIDQLLSQDVLRIYLLDNSQGDFETFRGWVVPPGVSVIQNHANLGYGRAHNIAIRESVREHDYHIVCNPDVLLGEGTIEVLRSMMDQRREVGLCMPKVLSPEGVTQYLCKRLPNPGDLLMRRFLPPSWFKAQRARYEMRDHSYDEEMEVQCLSGCFMFFRSSLLASLSGFDERFFLYLEDYDLSRRAATAGKNLYYPATSIVHQHSRGSYRSLRLLAIHTTSAIRYFNKWGWSG